MRGSKILLCLPFVFVMGFSALAAETSVSAKAPSKWSGSAAVSSRRGIMEDSNWYSIVDAGVAFAFYKSMSLTADLTYNQQLTGYDNSDSDFEDLEIAVSDSNLFSTRKKVFILSHGLGLAAPTSKTSQKAGQNFSSFYTMTGKVQLSSVFSLSLLNRIYYNNFKYETADEAGTEINSPVALLNMLTLGTKIYKGLSWSNSAGLYSYQNFAGHATSVIMAESALGYTLESWTLSMLFKNRNELVANNSLFDEEQTTIRMGLSYAF